MPVRFQRTNDLELVRSIMTHPALYPFLSDDSYPAPADFWPNPAPAIHYMIAYDTAIMGLFITHPLTPVLWQVHHAMLPDFKARSLEISRAFEDLLFSGPCRTIIGFTPACNRLACRFAATMNGMQRAGKIPNAYPKGGKLFDMVIFVKEKPHTI